MGKIKEKNVDLLSDQELLKLISKARSNYAHRENARLSSEDIKLLSKVMSDLRDQRSKLDAIVKQLDKTTKKTNSKVLKGSVESALISFQEISQTFKKAERHLKEGIKKEKIYCKKIKVLKPTKNWNLSMFCCELNQALGSSVQVWKLFERFPSQIIPNALKLLKSEPAVRGRIYRMKK